VIVATSLDRSVNAVAGVLAIMQTGAAFLPIDPDWPSGRTRMLLKDSGAAIWLRQDVRGFVVARTLREVPSEPASPTTNSDAAYVIYTSGSTGHPKGVIVSQEALLNRLEWMLRYLALRDDDVVLHKTPPTFDVSLWEMLLPLIAGCRLVLAPDGAHRDGEALVHTIQTEGITVVHFVPSALRGFLSSHSAQSRLRSLRNVICSGETLDVALLAETRAVIAARVHNLYGPTEAAIDVTAWECPPFWSPTGSVPIGWPIANTEVYVLDEEMEPCPDGVAGEIYIGGVQVARGYVNRPRMTAHRFVRNPFSDQPGAKLYRTGDLGRRLRDGVIEFLGREDSQVKIRGCRIELGEVEAAILHHASVRSAAAMAHRTENGGKQLVAYYVPRDGYRLTERVLRARLAQLLPRHMVPDVLVRLDELPTLENGKLDRSRLLPACRRRSAPRGVGETIMAHLWAELFHRDDIHADDDFFQLGGDSMLAIRLVARARAVGMVLGAEDVFRARTVRAMASLSKRSAQAADSSRAAFSLLSESSRAIIAPPQRKREA
jgi:nonribosomal peptide synthetase DhbF